MTNLVGLPGSKRKPRTRIRLECSECTNSLFGMAAHEQEGQPDIHEVYCLSCDAILVLAEMDISQVTPDVDA